VSAVRASSEVVLTLAVDRNKRSNQIVEPLFAIAAAIAGDIKERRPGRSRRRGSTGQQAKDERRFPVQPTGGSVYATAHPPRFLIARKRGGVSLRTLDTSHYGERPNVIVILRRVLEVPPAPRVQRSVWPVRRGPYRGAILTAAVADPDLARKAFFQWGVLRPITEAAIAGKGLSDEDRNRNRRVEAILVAGVLLWIAAEIGIAAFYASR
jgi:hypothetical protein